MSFSEDGSLILPEGVSQLYREILVELSKDTRKSIRVTCPRCGYTYWGRVAHTHRCRVCRYRWEGEI